MTGKYFYAEGEDKAGNHLITSYKKEEQAKKYRAGARISEGLFYLDINADGPVSEDTGLLVRTMMTKPEKQVMEGNFAIWAKVEDVWAFTGFRYGTYAAANTAVKGALIQIYDEVAVIEDDG